MQRPYGFVWLAALFAASCAKDEPQEPPTRLIAWAEVESADLAPTRRLSGVVVSASNATLAFEVPGKLAEVRVDTGDAFEEGAVLASLDRANFLLVAKQRRANLVAAEAAFQRALADFERHESLVSTGAVTQSRYESAKAEYESTQAQVAVAQAALDLAGKSLSDTRLLAPFAGTVTARHRDPAEQVSSRTPVVSIARSDSTTEIEVDVPETVISHLRVGTTHRVRLPALEEDALDARVTLIGSEASSSASFPVTLEFETPTESVRAGMTAEIEFELRAETTAGLRVPLAALTPGAEDQFVAFLYDSKTGTVSRRPVGVRSVEGDNAVVASGLAAGDIVATRGLSFLSDGQAVRLLGDGAARFDPPQGNFARKDVERAVVLQ